MQNCHPMVRMSKDLMQSDIRSESAAVGDATSTVFAAGAHETGNGGQRSGGIGGDSAGAAASTGTLRYSALPLELRGCVLCDVKAGLRTKLVPRYLILEQSLLHVFKRELTASDRALEPMLSIDMDTATVDVGSREFEIVLLLPGGKQFAFVVHEQDQLERWFYCLKRARNLVEEFYEVGKVIGKGSFGSVMIARDRLTGELCVVKQMTKNTRSRRQLALIDREMKILQQTDSHYVVRAYDIFNSPIEVCIVMELMRGGELYDVLTEDARMGVGMTEDIVCHIATQLLEGVAHLHALNIVHRDIKPENILLESRVSPPTVKLSDFGLSNLLDSGLVQENLLNSVVGSLLYVAPELLAGEGYGCSVDIWAIGVIVYAMLSGRLPFNIEDKQDYERFLRRGPVFVEDSWRGVSNASKWFLRGLLQVDPNRRLTARGALQHVWIQANPHSALLVPDEKYGPGKYTKRHSRLLDKLRAVVLVIDTLRFWLSIHAATLSAVAQQSENSTHNMIQKIRSTLVTDAAAKAHHQQQQRYQQYPHR
mmetsp:Transcript_5791/g.12211  ORF Transcript_5791/g.12211 Transcript_5791/m.12211 type:complete len:537 (-) Transcript_5791:82-1692(-)